MNFTRLFIESIKHYKHSFEYLLCQPTTESQLLMQLNALSTRSFCDSCHYNTLQTEFALNSLIMSKADNVLMTKAKSVLPTIWDNYKAIASRIDYVDSFPANENGTRLSQIAELVAKCSGLNKIDMAKIKNECIKVFALNNAEQHYFEDAIMLSKINYFIAVADKIQKGENYEKQLAPLFADKLTDVTMQPSQVYTQNVLHTKSITAIVDNLGESAVSYNGKQTYLTQSLKIFVNSRNVLDTFCSYHFGSRQSIFTSGNNRVKATMQMFVQSNSIVRKVTLTNIGKQKCFSIVLPFHTRQSCSHFILNNAVCIKTNETYFCLAVVENGKLSPLDYNNGNVVFDLKLNNNQTVCFDVVTLFGAETPRLSQQIDELLCYGGTMPPFIYDTVPHLLTSNKKLHVTQSSKMSLHNKHKQLAVNFSAKLGNSNNATMFDELGNYTTLINGFCFGIGGEKFFAIHGGKVTNLTSGNFTLLQHVATFAGSENNYNYALTMKHDEKTQDTQNTKQIEITQNTESKIIAVFPLEEMTEMQKDGETFTLKSKNRKLQIVASGIESFTTDVLECNADKLRKKLSNTLESTNCLSLCFKPSCNVKLEIKSLNTIPQNTPLLRESLVSTCINYLNDKNIFNLVNNLTSADALTVASICYTNPEFAKQYILSHIDNTCFHYNKLGAKVNIKCNLTFPLTALYYMSLTANNSLDIYTQEIIKQVFETYTGKDLCIKALCLKKMLSLSQFDKQQIVTEYAKTKSMIENDKTLNGLAQAMGILPLTNPSKERLRDLCNNNSIPKCYYYVSQIENLYGISLCQDRLMIRPNISHQNYLENISINIDGKSIQTSFAPSSVESMSLNGTMFFQAFKMSSLKSDTNKLVVGYK